MTPLQKPLSRYLGFIMVFLFDLSHAIQGRESEQGTSMKVRNRNLSKLIVCFLRNG
jgi:hypothetical protein